MIRSDFYHRFFQFAFWAGLFILLFCGCSVHVPKKIDPGLAIPDSYGVKAPLKTLPMTQDPWWESFGDKQLNRTLERAFHGNLDLSQAVSRLKQFEALSRKSRAGLFPQFNLRGDASRGRQLTAMGAETGNNYAASMAASYEVDLWNKLKSQNIASQFEEDASLEEIKTLYLTISAKTTDFYYLMIEQRAQLELTSRTIKARKATLKLVEERYLEGIVSSLDVYQARQSLANARARKPEIEATIATTAHALSVLIGEYPTSTSEGTIASLPDLCGAYTYYLPSELLVQRPDIRAALLRLKACDQKIGIAVAERFPSINLMADFGRAGTNFGTSLTETIWNLAGNLTLPLIDWGSRKAEVDRTKAVFDEQLGLYRQTILTAFQEVEDALVTHLKTEETIKRLSEKEAAAGSALHIAGNQYLDGLSDYLPVLTAQTLHFDAQIRLLSARRKLISARISLARSLGGNLMDQEIKKTLTHLK